MTALSRRGMTFLIKRGHLRKWRPCILLVNYLATHSCKIWLLFCFSLYMFSCVYGFFSFTENKGLFKAALKLSLKSKCKSCHLFLLLKGHFI